MAPGFETVGVYHEYGLFQPYHERNVLEEIREAEASGAIRFDPDGNLIVPGMPAGGGSPYQQKPPVSHHSPQQHSPGGGDTAPKPPKRSTSPPPAAAGGHHHQHSPYGGSTREKEEIFFEVWFTLSCLGL